MMTLLQQFKTFSATENGHIPQMTGVRALAAYMVYVHHFPVGQGLLPEWLYRLTLELHVGVGLFFVLSGFLIYQRYYDSCQMNGSWWGNYTKNRVARIYPMYFLLTCLTLINRSVRHGDADGVLWVLNLSFLRGFSQEYYMSGISQGWTLTVEECFYFSAPLVFWWLKRHDGKALAFWSPVLALYGLGMVLALLGDALKFHGFFQGFGFVISYTYFGRCFEFFVGMWLAKFMSKRRFVGAPPAVGFRLTLSALVGIGTVLFAMSLLQSPDYRYGVLHPAGKALNNLVLPPLYALLFFGLMREANGVQRFLATPTMVLLGKSSYIYYLVHMGVIQALVARVVCPETFTPITALQHLLQFIALNLVSIILFVAIEDPVNHWIRRHWRLGSAKHSQTAQAVS
jgi:peptidoglycan/LPS O-acetylase OafA/YrhL